MGKKNLGILIIIIFLSLLIRLLSIDFPSLTSDEARIAYRGYTIANYGTDELGRSFPIFFNSLEDYQLPVVSYITALGVGLFGKFDLGIRIPFILLGAGISALTFLIAQIFSKKKLLWFSSTALVAFSYPLIFLSKIPNESLVLAFLFVLLFYLLIKKIHSKLSQVIIFMLIEVIIFTSKSAWFIIIPFVLFTLYFYQKELDWKKKSRIIGFTFLSLIIFITFFLNIPQSKRSLNENNFSLFSNISIENGINRLRGQGLESGWPNLVERMFFNKSSFLAIGSLHWISELQPRYYFGQFDGSGMLNFSKEGVFAKILIIPFVWGLIYLVRKGKLKERLLLVYLIILTFPAILIYPSFSQNLVVLTIPFVAFVIAFGFTQLNQKLFLLIILIASFEIGLNLLYLEQEKKETNFLRPYWIKELTEDVYSQSINYKTAISDDIASDIVSFIELYNPVDVRAGYLDVPYPYKFRQTSLANIKIIGSDNEFYSCKENNYDKVFISKRDNNKIQDFNINTVKMYKDGLNQEVAYLLEKGICIK